MLDIQSATAEIRRGIKKEEERKKPQDKNIMSASAIRRAAVINPEYKTNPFCFDNFTLGLYICGLID